MKVAICVNTRDRPTELSLLMVSLKNQTHKDWDLYILDDQGGTALQNYHFFNCISNIIKMDNHNIKFLRTEFPHGVSLARQRILDEALKDPWDYYLRIDDDVICEPDFIEKLIEGMKEFDIMSGVTPGCAPQFVRDPEKMKIGARVVLDNKGNFIMNSDDYGMLYTDNKIIPSDHFRSSALIKREVFDKVRYAPTRLSKHGFREEQLFSFNAIVNGFKIGNHMNAIAWHLGCMSGGERFPDSNELVKFNEEVLKEDTIKLVEQNGNFIDKYHNKLGLNLLEPTEEELAISTNLIFK